MNHPPDKPDKKLRRRDRQIETAALIVEAVAGEVERGMPADTTLARIFRQHPEFGSRDRRIYSHAAYAYFRWLGWTRLIASDDTRVMIAWSIMLDPGSSDEILECWRDVVCLPEETLSALRREEIAQKGSILVKFLQESGQGVEPSMFAIANLMPAWVHSLWKHPGRLDAFIIACQSRPPTWLRIKATDIVSFRTMLETQQVRFFIHDKIAGAFAITSPFNLVQLERAFGQSIQVQDLASQAVGQICRPSSGDHWWDVCSGAGGKTLFLAEAVGPTGKILATDKRDTILKNLGRRASAHQVTHIETRVFDASAPPPESDVFDGILLDAPCSGTGTWPRNPDARWRTMASTVSDMALLQQQILCQAIQALKPGGTLVYSVCSISKAEGPGVIRTFLDSHPDFSLDPFIHPLTALETSGEMTIMPSDGPCDGMYVARLRRGINRS